MELLQYLSHYISSTVFDYFTDFLTLHSGIAFSANILWDET